MKRIKAIFIASLVTLLTATGCRQQGFDVDGIYSYNSIGEVVFISTDIPHTQSTSKIKQSISPNGEFIITYSGKEYRGTPGDYIFPLATSEKKLWLSSEVDSDFTKLVVFNTETKDYVSRSFSDAELQNILLYNDKLLGATIIRNGSNETIFFDKSLKLLSKKITIQTGGRLDFYTSSPCGKKMISRIFYPDRPETWIEVDTEKQVFRYLNNPSKQISLCNKYIISYNASDKQKIYGVLSIPKNGKYPLPLIVFPHGGPGSRSTTDYDFRVAELLKAGFAIFQPNYRGSRGFGKKFRQSGWRADGIVRGIDDIADGTTFLLQSRLFDQNQIFALGGSWGGFCVLSLMTRYPNLFARGVALFGACDIPLMLKSFPAKSNADPNLDKLQFGDISDPQEEANLRKISPITNINKWEKPLMIVHFKQDQVIEIEQAYRWRDAAEKVNKAHLLTFITGDGEHGWKNEKDELAAYQNIIAFLLDKEK